MIPADRVRLLLLGRDYLAAEQAAAEADVPAGERARLLRMVFARQERFDAAVRVGREVLASGTADREDHFRQAQVAMRCSLAAEALAAGLTALRDATP